MTALDKLYDRLSPEERLRAFVSALARKDLEEVDRLNDTCPKKTYVSEDAAYWRAKVDLIILVQRTYLDLANLEAALMVSVIAILVAEGSEEDDKGFETGKEIYQKVLRVYSAKQAAWRRFCAELGMNPEEVQAAFAADSNPLVSLIFEAVPLERPELDGALVEQMLSRLRSCWDSRRAG